MVLSVDKSTIISALPTESMILSPLAESIILSALPAEEYDVLSTARALACPESQRASMPSC